MPSAAQHLTITDLSGGRNTLDAITSPSLRPNQAWEMQNVDFYQTSFGRKRNGMTSQTLTFSSGGPFTDKISSMFRHVPGADETAAELWMVDNAATNVVGRKLTGASFVAPTLKDAPTGNGYDWSAASLGGKLFLAYKSGTARLHVWDPTLASPSVRRTGFAAPAAPTVANTGAGAYAAVLRYYRVRWTEQQAGVTVRRSEAGPSASFTPSGGGTAARITQPAVASESETHWEIEASTDNVSFFLLTTVAIGTTTYDDSAATTTYASGTASAITGTYALHSPYKFLAGDQNRLLGFGSWNSADSQNRVVFSAVLGSLNVGDLDRVNTTVTYYVDLDEADSGDPTGLEGPVFGNFYAFKAKQFWELRPTGDVTRPYQRSPISKSIGAVGPRAHCIGEDAAGSPCLYFMSHRGMYRYGAGGLRYIGRGIEDLVSGTDFTNFTNRINLVARVPCHMVYHADRKQLWVWWAVGTATTADPSILCVYHVESDGWTHYVDTTPTIETARCSCLFSRNLTGVSRDLKPYIGDSTTNNKAYMCDDTTASQSGFVALITLHLLAPWGLAYRGHTGDVGLLAANTAGSTVTLRAYSEGVQSVYQSGTALLTQTAADRMAQRQFEGTALADSRYVSFEVGEFAAANQAWTLFALIVPWWREEAAVA